ncbi:MAG TPA: hypothetical protein DDX12_01395 [Nitrospiraceae bacterium]|nr:hypothetical protein [Nitrospiraceae bacterium]
MTNQNIILYLGLAVLAVYFVLFLKLLNTLTKEEQIALQKMRSKFMMLTSVIPFIMLVYFNGFYQRLGLGAYIVISTTIETILHHAKLRRANFNPSYEQRLLKITYLSAIGTIFIISWFIITSRT